MGLKKFFKKQLNTVVEWTDQETSILFKKIDTPNEDEIKNASHLIVAPGQGCIMVYEGKVQGVITDPGRYSLATDNHPFITTLIKFYQAFESEHKMRIYFFRTAELLNLRWGTASPIKYMDSTYKFPVEVGVYGNFALKLINSENFFSNLMGSKDEFTANDLREVVVARIIPLLSSYLAQSSYSYLNIDAHLSLISSEMKEKSQATFSELGLELTDFRIESTSFDEESCERINKIAGMTAEALSAAEVGLDYVHLEKLRALRDAARNEGGLAGAGLQVGAGFELSKSLMTEKEKLINEGEADPITQLKKLKTLLDEEIITKEEFDEKKKELLAKL